MRDRAKPSRAGLPRFAEGVWLLSECCWAGAVPGAVPGALPGAGSAVPSLLPVLVHVHGGAFEHGSGRLDAFGPHFLITAEVIVVSLNNRLGSLGKQVGSHGQTTPSLTLALTSFACTAALLCPSLHPLLAPLPPCSPTPFRRWYVTSTARVPTQTLWDPSHGLW